jgi:GNAT superfamily N-acetyltransferase
VRAPELNAECALRQAVTRNDIDLARSLFLEYAQWLKIDLCFQGFESELQNLPGAYAPPRGCLLLAGPPDDAFGCVALRPLASPEQGEVKRLYVQPSHRGTGCARTLVAALIARAAAIGYRELMLDTLDWMTAARSLYAAFGFTECEAYYHNPLPGVVYMRRRA